MKDAPASAGVNGGAGKTERNYWVRLVGCVVFWVRFAGKPYLLPPEGMRFPVPKCLLCIFLGPDPEFPSCTIMDPYVYLLASRIYLLRICQVILQIVANWYCPSLCLSDGQLRFASYRSAGVICPESRRL